jgi:LysM repeat protein
MNFSSESVKLKSKPQNEDFCFDLETPRGHFFAVLDFAPHDYANLNAELNGKLETIVGSSASLPKFSADFFLGFLAKKINNLLNDLGTHSGGPELLCSAALCFVSGDQLSYFLCGNASMSISSGGQLLALPGLMNADPGSSGQTNEEMGQLGARSLETPLTDRVGAYNLKDDDVVLMMTPGIEEALAGSEITDEILRMPDSKPILDAVMDASTSVDDDRTLVVIAGPYERQVDPLADLTKAIADLEAKVSALTGGGDNSTAVSQEKELADSSQLEQRFSQEIEVLKDDLKSKAANVYLVELDQKIRNLSAVVAGKADTADLQGLQSDVSKLGVFSNAGNSEMAEAGFTSAASESNEVPSEMPPVAQAPRRFLGLKSALLILVIATGGAFVGTWLQSRIVKKPQEVRPQEIWSVKTSGNHIVISRLDSGGRGSVALNVAQPLNSTGEQTFSSFADVKRYIDTIATSAPLDQNTQTSQSASNQNTQATSVTDAKKTQATQAADAKRNPAVPPKVLKKKVVEKKPAVTEITIKPGDSLNRLAQRYKVPPEKIMKLNPTVTSWPRVRTGQKIVVPAAP